MTVISVKPTVCETDAPWLGQYCLNVTDIERTIGFYELLGLTCTSRTEIPHAHEAILEHPGRGGKLQLAQQVDQDGPVEMGSMWKLYVNTDDCQALYDRTIAAGCESMSEPVRMDRWPVTVAFVKNSDGYLVELVEYHEGTNPGVPDPKRVASPA